MTANTQLEKAYRFCVLLKNETIKEELDNNLIGYSLENIQFKNGQFECYFKDEDCNSVSLLISSKLIHLTKYQENITSSIIIEEDMMLREQSIDKRSNGVILTDMKKQFAPSIRFNNRYVLVDLWENRYIFSKRSIEKILGKDDYNSIKATYILLKLKCMSDKIKLEELCDFYNTFSTHMNWYLVWSWGRFITDNACSNRTYLNNEEVSRIYDIVDGYDKLYRIYDLYNGIINARNINDINAINLGLLYEDAFGLKELRGITDEENNLVGESNGAISEQYILYLKQVLCDKFGYEGEIKFDRETLMNAIKYKVLDSELTKTMSENKIEKNDKDYSPLCDNIHEELKKIDILKESFPKMLLRRIFKRNNNKN